MLKTRFCGSGKRAYFCSMIQYIIEHIDATIVVSVIVGMEIDGLGTALVKVAPKIIDLVKFIRKGR